MCGATRLHNTFVSDHPGSSFTQPAGGSDALPEELPPGTYHSVVEDYARTWCIQVFPDHSVNLYSGFPGAWVTAAS